MVIDTKLRVFVFAAVVTVLILVLAEVLNYFVFPAEILPITMRGTVVIVCLIAMPTFGYIGWMLYTRAILSRELQTLVNRDRLTDVATRDFFFARLAANDSAYGASLMVDIDHFKRVNDNFGHFAGDKVISMVAQVLKMQIREEDIVCRFGGEEFVIFLHHATKEEAWTIAERIRIGTEEATAQTERGPIKVTVSVGGSLKDQIEHIDESILRADACLYAAKKLGRNRTVVDWDEETIEALPTDLAPRVRVNVGRRRDDGVYSNAS